MVRKGQQVATAARRTAFLAHLRSMGDGTPCVPWPWSAERKTYIRIAIDGKFTSAHRWVYENVVGPIPEGMEVCHTCDNPSCVRPSHLFAGTHSDNIRDAYAKGRAHGNTRNHVTGERHHAAKLTAPQIAEIRSRAAEGQSKLAREFGVSHTAIHKIVHGSNWKS